MKYAAAISIVAVIIAIFAYNTVFAPPHDEVVSVQSGEEMVSEDEVSEVEPSKLSGYGTLASLREFSDDLECNISYQPSELESVVTGTYFVSDGRIRGDFLTKSPEFGGEILSSVIIEGDYFYAWSEIEGKSYGVKMEVEAMNNTDFENNEPVPMDSEVRYNCAPWENIDNSVFNPPSEVLFRDVNDLMPAGMEYGTVYEEELNLQF